MCNDRTDKVHTCRADTAASVHATAPTPSSFFIARLGGPLPGFGVCPPSVRGLERGLSPGSSKTSICPSVINRTQSLQCSGGRHSAKAEVTQAVDSGLITDEQMGIRLMLDRPSDKSMDRARKIGWPASGMCMYEGSFAEHLASVSCTPPCLSRQEACRNRWACRQTKQALLPPALTLVGTDVHRNQEDRYSCLK